MLIQRMCLCLGPLKSGKTMLLKNLRGDKIDEATITVRTNGVSLYTVRNAGKDFELVIREIGGSMAPIWHHHLDKVFLTWHGSILV